MKKEIEIIGKCPICDRDMWKGDSINKHHFIPKCRGGKESEYLHRICHNKIHSVWPDEKILEREFNDPEIIKQNEEIIKFIKFVKNKEPDYYDRNERKNK